MAGERLAADASIFIPVHFLFQREGEREYRIACMPEALELSRRAGRPMHPQCTDDPRAVACQFCKTTEDFKREVERCGYQGVL